MLDFDFEPFDPRFSADPVPYYKQLRKRAPVYRTAKGYWVISRYDDIREIQQQPQVYSSSAVGQELLGVGQRLDPSVPVAELAADLPVSLEEVMNAPLMVATDPPKHTQLRSLVNRGFTPKRAKEWDEKIQTYTAEFLRGVTAQTAWDVMSTLAMPLPYAAMCGILGLENEDRAHFKAWSDIVLGAAHGEDRGSAVAQTRMLTMMREFILFFHRLITERRKSPGSDLISDLVRAEEAETLNTVEVLMFILALMVAGTETSMKLIGNMVVCLQRHPDQLRLLQSNPALLSGAVEETLRYHAPIHYSIRTPVTDVEFRGHRIRPGEIVCLVIASGNFDETHFSDPERYDISREARTHMTFGYGIHHCLGAHLARREAIISIGTILPDLHRWRLGEGQVQRESNHAGIGYRRVGLVPC
jgi:cytochrome P450